MPSSAAAARGGAPGSSISAWVGEEAALPRGDALELRQNCAENKATKGKGREKLT